MNIAIRVESAQVVFDRFWSIIIINLKFFISFNIFLCVNDFDEILYEMYTIYRFTKGI